MAIASHITHEAVQKVGGIGSVINGLATSANYQKVFSDTVLVAPLFKREIALTAKLGKDGQVLYSGIEKYDKQNLRSIFQPIEEKYNIHIVYGKRNIANEISPNIIATVDVLLIDIQELKKDIVDAFKYRLWKSFALESDLYNDWDYEQYMRIAIPYPEILQALYKKQPTVHFCHEYMGVPSGISILLNKEINENSRDKVVFYAHEVSTVRNILENHPGHDVMFYNVMRLDQEKGISLEEEFGSQKHHYRTELARAAARFDYIFAVSDLIKEEYQYLVPSVPENKIKIVYNGIPHKTIDMKEKEESRGRIKAYCQTLFNFVPDVIFTHVTRLVHSKGIWRDIKFLHYLDEWFARGNKKGFFVLLSTLVATGRPPLEVAKMEYEYGWPVLHRKGWPDLIGIEEEIYDALSILNSKSLRIKCVFINQFGFNRNACGIRVPMEAGFFDLRCGSDVEFGLSTYEPFGIAQLETFPFGGLPIMSKACGSSYLIDQLDRNSGDGHEIFFPIDFAQIPSRMQARYRTVNDFKAIGIAERDQIEEEIAKRVSPELFKMVSNHTSRAKQALERNQRISDAMSWDNIFKNNIMQYFADMNE